MASRRDTIVIGGSAGSVRVLLDFLGSLPADLEASIAIVVHVSDKAPTQLDRILARSTHLTVVVPADGAALRAGCVILGPPGQHLGIEDGAVRLWQGPRENHFRPAVDVLFRSAALARGPRVIGVLLSGALHDGAAGLEAIRRRGGITVVQDPADAEFPSMPQTAIDAGQADVIAPANELAARVRALVGAEVPDLHTGDDELEREVAVARGLRADDTWKHLKPTEYICPDCGGPLRRARSALPRFRCRVGHAFEGNALLREQGGKMEEALSVAARMMDDRAILYGEMADASRERAQTRAAEHLTGRADATRAHAGALRSLLASFDGLDEA